MSCKGMTCNEGRSCPNPYACFGQEMRDDAMEIQFIGAEPPDSAWPFFVLAAIAIAAFVFVVVRDVWPVVGSL